VTRRGTAKLKRLAKTRSWAYMDHVIAADLADPADANEDARRLALETTGRMYGAGQRELG
jgi:hypothetical protein